MNSAKSKEEKYQEEEGEVETGELRVRALFQPGAYRRCYHEKSTA